MKVIRKKILADPDVADRFLREIRLASAHVHANLVDTYDRGRDDAVGLWVVMEFLQGQDLRHALLDWQQAHPGRPFPPSATVGIFTQICRGLDALHQRGIVHCDLKPSNVFITRDDAGWPRVKLLDFGCAEQLWMLAKPDEGDVLVTGTVPYMAPEAFEGERGTGTDVYALGCMLFQALTGRFPHVRPGDEPKQWMVLFERRSAGAPDVSDIAGSANRRVANLVRDALAPDPRRRIQDVQAFGRRLTRAYDRAADGWR
jgi:serine/threonine protein kinase